MTIRPLGIALGAAAFATVSSPALTHAVLERPEAQEGSFYRAVVQITHGCKGSPTTAVTVTVPEGAVGARPLAKPGWAISTKRGPYARTYPFVHGSIAEGVKEITWTGGTVPNDQFDEFVFSVRMSDAFKPGDTVRFPVVQNCETGAYRWVEVPTPGQDAHAVAEPAPSVRIISAAAKTALTAPSAVKAGALTIEQPWMRATPGGAKVAGGYVRITNSGTEPDRLVATSIPVAARGEVHEMSVVDGIMRMRPVEGGIEIRPGQTVELKPGGYHLMFMDLTSGPKEGETVRGTLTFEKAGKVDVVFGVTGIGAQGPAPEHQH